MADIEGTYEVLENIEITGVTEDPAKPFILMAAAEDADKIIKFCSENGISIYIGER